MINVKSMRKSMKESREAKVLPGFYFLRRHDGKRTVGQRGWIEAVMGKELFTGVIAASHGNPISRRVLEEVAAESPEVALGGKWP